MRNLRQIKKFKIDDQGYPTDSSNEQKAVEDKIERGFDLLLHRIDIDPQLPKLLRTEHIHFVKGVLRNLPKSYECLDASRTWICYWVLHSLSLLDVPVDSDTQTALIQFLKKCQSKSGGFGGGPGQYSHLATTYAAVNALCIIGTEEAYEAIDREALYRFFWSVKSANGALCMHVGGEQDIRGAYCALAVASLTNILTEELFQGTAEWMLSCQTYEGGFAGSPEMEAHGGYTFCGLAGLAILKKLDALHLKSFKRWLVNKQMKFEGGFQGRTNKLVDGCYSFWQGGAFPILHNIILREEEDIPDSWLFHQEALQEYILICCQFPNGGLVDKPGKPRDVYHTCYTLSGLSVAQHFEAKTTVIGHPSNQLMPTHPVYNIVPEKVSRMLEYFKRFPPPNTISYGRE